ncbi:hypothetical protein BB560_002136 [Smittium megazygosporum]|uniref:glutathione transferase n=1 Tax=Smittium megazygosporum TaxID=133381 RepID=A0A2T9ZFP5_9FUNG|nr:hypothetical protein BB560_006604 [Smittium megazygosporum]PVV03398.1 hypothetical protein BB560_002136 [Smittium megazygosporum]
MTQTTTYKFEYFSFDVLGWLARALLSLADAEYTNVFPDWPADKAKTPFGHLPVLTETSPDGSKFVVAESSAIELYLAEKYGFLPENRKHKAIAMQYYFQIRDIYDSFFMHSYVFKSEQSRERYLGRINDFIERHEPILAQSEYGFYCGDSLTLPDIYLYYLYKINTEHGDQSLNGFANKDTPAISKLAANVGIIPNIKKAHFGNPKL